MIHLMIGGSIFAFALIKVIPMAVLFGLFLFMGFATPAEISFGNVSALAHGFLSVSEHPLHQDCAHEKNSYVPHPSGRVGCTLGTEVNKDSDSIPVLIAMQFQCMFMGTFIEDELC